jgi:hypothetical protein
MTKQLWITEKVNNLLDEQVREHGIKKEGLAHAILFLGLTDESFLKRALGFHGCLNKGAELLDKIGL